VFSLRYEDKVRPSQLRPIIAGIGDADCEMVPSRGKPVSTGLYGGNHMKMNRFRFSVLVFALMAVGIVPLHAGVIFQFNEFGTFSYSLNGGTTYTSLPSGILEADPTSAESHITDALVFDLTSVLNGIVLYNGDAPIGGFSGGISDDLRFTTTGGGLTGNEVCAIGSVECLMVYYSFDSLGSPADVGNISTSFLTTQTTAATEAANGSFSYNAGLPTYDGSSDVVAPEPVPAAMLLLGLGSFGFLAWRRNATTSKAITR
jgi:hypothetical protein